MMEMIPKNVATNSIISNSKKKRCSQITSLINKSIADEINVNFNRIVPEIAHLCESS